MDHYRINAIPVTGTLKVEQSVDGPFEATSIRFDYSRHDLWFQGEYVDGLGKTRLITLVLPDKAGAFSGGFNPDAAGYYNRETNDRPQYWHSVSGHYKATFIKGAGDLDGEFHFQGSWPGSEKQEFKGTFDIQTGPLSVKAKTA
ncbi:hypothetical protein RCO22_18555 [Pseudomonas yamanorum]|jgi:hypothetical protein|uniref:Uncharacterized protein n=1 Tax=Pseudomonas yamanorum TaxID=515393 RepID=A0A1H2I355_9PSED|nr:MULTISPECIES: hypothetical protein [Pseudomonas]MBK5408483.1 hypothetical protein [Pseudomonas sp. TH34]MBV6664909.1 hypothetical protein [Pseudomonas yamanorum]MDR0190949.1 hypothetical protein [Pseudomonas yamanorum]NVZ92272.1 hypothetical protein [Pseudomonas yamanorum]NWD41653.1 hypothetical protein [Pseudomonas yamanorum]